MALEVITGDWDREDGALRIEGDKPTIRFASGPVAGSQSWITQVGSNGPGNFEFYTQALSAPTAWALVMALATDGSVGIGESNPFSQATGKLIVSVATTPNLNAVVGVNAVTDALTAGNGGWFSSLNGEGVRGQTATSAHGGVVGVNTGGGDAVYGISEYGGAALHGVANGSKATGQTYPTGVSGDVNSGVGTGVYGHCTDGLAMHAVADKGTALLAEANGPAGSVAGQFNGDVVVSGNVLVSKDIQVTGDIQLVGGNDCAECFEVTAPASPGMVMMMQSDGTLGVADQPYDSRVAGVVSGGGNFRPGLVLGKFSEQRDGVHLALLGRAQCKVDASYGPIKVGDLITSSQTPGHGMVAKDKHRAFGSIIGKSMTALAEGQGEVTLLITLQ